MRPHWMLDRNAAAIAVDCLGPAADAVGLQTNALIPDYLNAHYWWAYIHPRAVQIFERQWLVNLILCGNYARLRDAALAELGETLPGSTLQVACVYGDLTNRLSERARAGGGAIDVVDILPVQLSNLRRKLPAGAPARLLKMDSASLKLPDARYDRALVFFLLHEQPRSWRNKTLREVLRVVKPGGKIVIVDYARPGWWHPLRYLFPVLLARLEPFCARSVARRYCKLAAANRRAEPASSPLLRWALSSADPVALKARGECHASDVQ